MKETFFELDNHPFTRLPNPKRFLVLGASIVKVKENPHAFSDGFMADLDVRAIDEERLNKVAVRQVSGSMFNPLISSAKSAIIQLSEPRFIADLKYPSYILFYGDDIPLAIQIKYHRYFRNRYKTCQFYTSDVLSHPKAVRVDNKLVGMLMVLFMPQEMIEEVVGMKYKLDKK